MNPKNTNQPGAAPDVKDSRQQKKLIMGTLAALGAIHLTGWELQAHGNRSSHSPMPLCSDAAAGSFGPDDYLVMRQTITAPSAAATQRLLSLKSQMDALTKADPAATASSQYKQLQSQRADLEASMKMRPISNQVLSFLKVGDVDSATAVIEGQGDTDRVMMNYSWVMLDIIQRDRRGLGVTPEEAAAVAPVARAAAAFAEEKLDRAAQSPDLPNRVGLLMRASEVLFNAASFIVPDTGTVDPSDLALATKCAKKALDINQHLKLQSETMYATWKLGFIAMRGGDDETARQCFERAAAMAVELKEPRTEAWAKVFLAKMLADQSPDEAARLKQQGWAIAEKLRAGGDAEIEFLFQTPMAQ